MKKILIIAMISLLFITGCGNNNNDNKELKLGEINNIKESTKEMPVFTIVIKGLKETTITEKDLKDLKMYDFETNIRKNDLDGNTELYTSSFTGVKLKEALEKKNIKDFDSIDFKAVGNLTVRYSKEELTDEMYLVFYKDGKSLKATEDTEVMLLVPSLKNRYWVPSLTRMDII